MQVAEANRIALAALRAVLGAAHPFELSIGGKVIRVSLRPPQAVGWPKGPEGLDEQKDGPWPPSILLDCAWSGGRVTLEMRASISRGNNRYRGQLALQVVTSPLNREIVWSSIAARIITNEIGYCAVPASMTLYAREGERDTRRLFASLTEQARDIGLYAITPAMFRMFEVVGADGSLDPPPHAAFERAAKAALVKLPYVVRGEKSDVEGTAFIDIDRLRPSPPPPAPRAPSPAPAMVEVKDFSTQEPTKLLLPKLVAKPGEPHQGLRAAARDPRHHRVVDGPREGHRERPAHHAPRDRHRLWRGMSRCTA
jgi:hypothetical protein